jgi:REP element-mobilizing transposase RayT
MAQNKKTLFNPKGAGRPKIPPNKKNYIPHRERETIPKKTPVHVTIKINKHIVHTLRNKIIFQKISRAITKARNKGIRLVHFTIQRDHVHMLIEAENKNQLGKAMQALGISFSKSLKSLTKTKLKIFKDRYHVHILKTLKEVRNAKSYILGNAIKHGVIRDKFDTFSSIVKVNELAWQFDFEKYFTDLIHFLEYEDLITALVDTPEYYLCKR